MKKEAGYSGLADLPEQADYDAIVLAVPHRHFLDSDLKGLFAQLGPNAMVFDLKSALPMSQNVNRL